MHSYELLIVISEASRHVFYCILLRCSVTLQKWQMCLRKTIKMELSFVSFETEDLFTLGWDSQCLAVWDLEHFNGFTFISCIIILSSVYLRATRILCRVQRLIAATKVEVSVAWGTAKYSWRSPAQPSFTKDALSSVECLSEDRARAGCFRWILPLIVTCINVCS